MPKVLGIDFDISCTYRFQQMKDITKTLDGEGGLLDLFEDELTRHCVGS